MPPEIDWLITELHTHGGAENFVRLITPKLIEKGVHIRLITLQSGGIWLDELKNSGIPIIELGMTRKNFILPIFQLYEIWTRERPDLVHTHLYHAGIVGRWVAYICQIQTVIVHQHGLELKRSYTRSIIDRYSSRVVNRYVVSCKAISSILQTREKIPAQKIQVINNGIDPMESVTNLDKNFERKVKNLPGDVIVLCAIGRLSQEKGHLYLLKALHLLAAKNIFPHLVLIGNGPEKKRLEMEVNKLCLTDQVHFVGIQKDISKWLGISTIFILPSLWEGISFALLEAMSAGLPVIATNVGGTPEIISNECNGLLVPPQNPEALEKAILQLMNDPILADNMAKQAQRTIAGNFTTEQVAQNLINLYATSLKDIGDRD